MPYKDKDKERKRCRFKRWRNAGLIGDYEEIHNKFINTTECDICKCSFSNKRKCMEHSHITGEFRGIVCIKCNANMLDQSIRTTNKSGIKNIHQHKDKKKYYYWVYHKRHYGKTKSKSFKNKIDAICYKFIHTLQLRVLRRQ